MKSQDHLNFRIVQAMSVHDLKLPFHITREERGAVIFDSLLLYALRLIYDQFLKFDWLMFSYYCCGCGEYKQKQSFDEVFVQIL